MGDSTSERKALTTIKNVLLENANFSCFKWTRDKYHFRRMVEPLLWGDIWFKKNKQPLIEFDLFGKSEIIISTSYWRTHLLNISLVQRNDLKKSENQWNIETTIWRNVLHVLIYSTNIYWAFYLLGTEIRRNTHCSV